MKKTQKDFRTYFESLYEEAEKILISRQAQYGASNIESLGIPGVFYRLNDDKMSRIRKALNGSVTKGRVVLSEESLAELRHPSVRDALIDAANYCLIMISLIDNEWSELELHQDDQRDWD